MSVDPTSPDVLTDADYAVIEKGFQCELLLNSPAFAEAINNLSNDLANQILTTDLGEYARREELYRLHKSLELLIGKLNAAVSAKAEVERHAAELAEQQEEQFEEEK